MVVEGWSQVLPTNLFCLLKAFPIFSSCFISLNTVNAKSTNKKVFVRLHLTTCKIFCMVFTGKAQHVFKGAFRFGIEESETKSVLVLSRNMGARSILRVLKMNIMSKFYAFYILKIVPSY